MNTAYGGPEALPFDLRQRRVITYHLDENTDKAAARTELAQKLERHLRAIIQKSNVTTMSALTAPEKAEQYASLRDATQRSDWYEARKFLNGLKGYRDVDTLGIEILAECARLDELFEDAVDALANNELIKLIKTGQLLERNATPAISEQIKKAWETLDFGGQKEMYRYLGSDDPKPVSIALTPNGHYAIIGFADYHVKTLDLRTGTEQRPSQSWFSQSWTIAPMPDNRSIMTPDDGYNVKQWDFFDGSSIANFALQRSYRDWPEVSSIAITPDGTKLLVGHEDGNIRQWVIDSVDFSCVFKGHDERVNTIVFLAGGSRFISGSDDGTFQLWSLDQCSSPDKTSGRTRVVETALKAFQGMKPGVKALAVTPDNKYVISVAANKTMHLWEIATGSLKHTFSGFTGQPQCLVISPDGYSAFTGLDNGVIVIWDLMQGIARKTIRPVPSNRRATRAESAVSVLAMTPDGHKLVFGTTDGSVYLLELPRDLFIT